MKKSEPILIGDLLRQLHILHADGSIDRQSLRHIFKPPQTLISQSDLFRKARLILYFFNFLISRSDLFRKATLIL